MSSDIMLPMTLAKPAIPETWDYDESVDKVTVSINKWKFTTVEFLYELWIAREKLSSSGGYKFHKEVRGTNVPSTWEGYCEDIALEKRTANRWLHRYFDIPEVVVTPKLPTDKYRVIYADPPWDYGMPQHSKEEQETVLETHYQSMPTEEICALPIDALCADDSVLFIWATSPLIRHAFEVIDAWGFNYKAMFIWDKVKHNVGYYNSVRHELLLICTRGKCLPDKKPEGEPMLIDSVQSIERSDHSRKPEEFRTIIDNLYPSGKRIELFARKESVGWDTWGNENVQSV
jgi:N6-adenosine-specific RNA methylase IME4